MTWVVGASACLVSVLFIVYLYKNAAKISRLLGGRLSRPETQAFRAEEYTWVVLVVILIVVAVLLLPFFLDMMTQTLGRE